jgi:hypothetical protein
MSTTARSSWKKRRIILPALALLLVAVALAIAVIRSDTSEIMIYNDTGATLGPLTVRACGQQYMFNQIADETSVRIQSSKGGPASPVELKISGEPAWHWEGSYLESRGGYLVFVHLRPGMEVETNTQISIWQQALFGRSVGH